MKIVLPIEPIGMPRPRCYGNTVVSMPSGSKIKSWMSRVRSLLVTELHGFSFEGPLLIDWVAVFKRPKYMRKKNKKGEYKYSTGLVPYTKKPDRDNIDKALLDACRDLFDDAIVVGGTVCKVYSEIWGKPRMEVFIRPMPDVRHFVATIRSNDKSA